MRLSLAAVLVLGMSAIASAQTNPAPWSYQGKTGPVNWGKAGPGVPRMFRGTRAIAGGHSRRASEQESAAD